MRAAEPRRQPLFGVGMALSGQTAPAARCGTDPGPRSLRPKRLMSVHVCRRRASAKFDQERSCVGALQELRTIPRCREVCRYDPPGLIGGAQRAKHMPVYETLKEYPTAKTRT